MFIWLVTHVDLWFSWCPDWEGIANKLFSELPHIIVARCYVDQSQSEIKQQLRSCHFTIKGEDKSWQINKDLITIYSPKKLNVVSFEIIFYIGEEVPRLVFLGSARISIGNNLLLLFAMQEKRKGDQSGNPQALLIDTKHTYSVTFPFCPSSIGLESIDIPNVLKLSFLVKL